MVDFKSTTAAGSSRKKDKAVLREGQGDPAQRGINLTSRNVTRSLTGRKSSMVRNTVGASPRDCRFRAAGDDLQKQRKQFAYALKI